LSGLDYEITIDYISEGEVANLMRGFVTAKGEKVRFTGVAYGRFGGQNVSPQLTPAAKRKAKTIFGDVQKFEEDLQQRLVRGDFNVKVPEGFVHSHSQGQG
jgi:hypothetical protein